MNEVTVVKCDVDAVDEPVFGEKNAVGSREDGLKAQKTPCFCSAEITLLCEHFSLLPGYRHICLSVKPMQLQDGWFYALDRLVRSLETTAGS